MMFIVSVLIVIISSYLILSCISKRNTNANFPGFIYFLLIAFSQIVLSFEILSLFKSISRNGILLFNIVILLISVILSIKNGKYLYKPQLKRELQKIIYSLKKDKLLGILSVCFIFFLVAQLISALFLPITFGDALTYYLTRCTAWIQNGSINHYITPDTRELIMPVNMEFLYTWLLLFRKSEAGCAIFSYLSYICGVYIIYSFLKELGFSVRRRIWSIFVFSSFVLVSIEMFTPCADMFIGVLILGSIYLFYKSAKENNNIHLFFSALSYALAVGTKTTAIIAIPSVFVVISIITYLYKKEMFWKYIFKFGGFFILNFIIFSSYNYILNLIQFSNPVSCSEQLLLNQFRGGFKGWLCNLIKYLFVIFDISGIADFIHYNEFIAYLRASLLKLIGENIRSYTSAYFSPIFPIDSRIGFMRSFLGIMGLLTFLPSFIKSIIKYLKNKTSKRKTILAALSMALILYIMLFARVMVFTHYNMRYLFTFFVIATPIVAYSYIKNTTIFKILLCFIIFMYTVIVSSEIPYNLAISYYKYIHTRPSVNTPFYIAHSEGIDIYNYLVNNKIKKVALILPQTNTPNFHIEQARLAGIHIDKLLLENIEDYHLSDYEYIITAKENVSSTYVVKFADKMKYRDLFVSKCLYYDYKQDTIMNLNTKPAMVQCEIPFEYFEHKGFIVDKDMQLNDYVLLKNTSMQVYQN